MKKEKQNICTALFVILGCAVNVSNGQTMESQQVCMHLKKFYVKYFHASFPKQNLGKIKELQKSNCTAKAFRLAQAYEKGGQDYLTKDYGFSSESLKSMSVTATKKPSTYCVSYVSFGTYTEHPTKVTKENVVLLVEIEKTTKGVLIQRVF